MVSFSPFNYLHVRGWLDVAEGSMIRMGVEQVQRDGDVVILTPVWHRDCALVIKIFSLVFLFLFSYLNVDEVPLLAVIESELVLLGSESLVVVDQSLNLVYTIKPDYCVFSVLVFHPTQLEGLKNPSRKILFT